MSGSFPFRCFSDNFLITLEESTFFLVLGFLNLIQLGNYVAI